MTELILITGSGGKSGRAVAEAMMKRGYRLRLFRKANREQTDEPSAPDAAEIVKGDLTDFAQVAAACQGVDGVYHIGPNMHQAETQIGLNAVHAAEQAGVEHFVYHSVLHPQIEAMPHHWRKLRVEQALLESQLPFTILQPAAYFQNVQNHWAEITASGLFQVPYRSGTRLSQVDLRDVAEVAGQVMLKPEHYYAVYPLVGMQAMDQTEVAELMAEVTGRSIKAVEVDRESWGESALAAGIDRARLQDFLAMFEYYSEHDFIGNPKVLAMLLSRAPASLESYVQELASMSGQHSLTSSINEGQAAADVE